MSCLADPVVQGALSAVGATLSGFATLAAVVLAFLVHSREKKLSQRQLLLPLWDHMATLDAIDPHQPITSAIVKAVNTLELVALACEGEMVDPQLIRRTFRERYLELYESISLVKDVPGTGKSGLALLRENRAAQTFYQQLEKERLSQDKVR